MTCGVKVWDEFKTTFKNSSTNDDGSLLFMPNLSQSDHKKKLEKAIIAAGYQNKAEARLFQ
jgi:hypothetical protein